MSETPAYDENGGMIVGPYRPAHVAEMAHALLDVGNYAVPRELLAAIAQAAGWIIAKHFSPDMRDGVTDAFIDRLRENVSRRGRD